MLEQLLGWLLKLLGMNRVLRRLTFGKILNLVQRKKQLMSPIAPILLMFPNSPKLVDFVFRLSGLKRSLDGQVNVLGDFFEEIYLTHCTCKNFLG